MKKLFAIISFVFIQLSGIFAQSWQSVIDTSGGFNWHISGGPVRALKYVGGYNSLEIGGEFDSLSNASSSIWTPPILSLEPNGVLSGVPDCAPLYFNASRASIWAIATVFDTSTFSNFFGVGGKFNFCGCSVADPQLYGQSKNLQVWDLMWGYINTTQMDQMDTVFALSMTENRTHDVICPTPCFKTYVGARRTFCSTTPAYCDSSSFIGMYTGYQGCNFITDRNYMQGGTNGPVYAIEAIDTGNVYAGGIFDSAGVIKAKNIARWNGINWDSLGSGINGTVKAIVSYQNKIFVGGSFTMAGGVPANNIAVWNGSAWSALGAGTNGPVYALTIHNSNLIAGGAFTMAGGNSANHVAKWNGVQWFDLGGGRNDEVYALASFQGDIYAGGRFTGGASDTARYIAHYHDTITGTLGIQDYGNGLFVSVYPNPSPGIFNIGCSEQIISVSAIDILGNEVYRVAGTAQQANLSSLPAGLYFFRIETSKGITVQKAFKE